MKSLTVDIYRITFRLSKIKPFSRAFALIYMSCLNYIMFHGLGLLMEGWIPYFSIVHLLFAFPYNIITAIGVMAGTYMLMPSQSALTKASERKGNVLIVLVYTLIAAVLFVFMNIAQ